MAWNDPSPGWQAVTACAAVNGVVKLEQSYAGHIATIADFAACGPRDDSNE